MTKQSEFVSVDEQALETVSGGLLNIGNGSLSNNNISLLSGLTIDTGIGDVASHILNILNDVGGCGC